MRALIFLTAWVAAAMVFAACGPGDCPPNSMPVGERCLPKGDTGTSTQPDRGAQPSKPPEVTQPVAGARDGAPMPEVRMNRPDGESCARDAECSSGHCDGFCCAKGSECCLIVSDCTLYAQGVGAACEDRSQCRGAVGKMTCSPDFRCVVSSGVRNDMACSARVEANDCGPYPAVYCSGDPQQTGAPECATDCSDDGGCDEDAHCKDGSCVPDLADGEPCDSPTQCEHGTCKNSICCGSLGDCCKSPKDCPDIYRTAAKCVDQLACSGTERVALCEDNQCASMMKRADAACDGKAGPVCGHYRDIICKSGNATCPTSCTDDTGCDDTAFCDAGRCLPKRADGQPCATSNQCSSDNCGNGACCASGMECCRAATQCTQNLDLRCDNKPPCQGSRRAVTCRNWSCVYQVT